MASASEKRNSPVRIAVASGVVAGALVVSAALAEAHDFWIIPNAFSFAPGSYVEVRGQTSSKFPTSEAAVTVDRVEDARLLSATGSTLITRLAVSGTSLLLRHRPRERGQRVVAVTLHPRSVRESTAGFRRYLELEGAPDALARVDREGLLAGRDSVTRRYAKYAKTTVEVGAGGPRAFTRVAGHPLEFLPAQDPASLVAGDTLAVRLVYLGEPLAGARLHAGFVPAPGGRVQLDAVAPEPDQHLVTDSEGLVRVPVTHAGLWNVRTIHVVQAAPHSAADWDTHWATLVFHVGRLRPSSSSRNARGAILP